ncbi:alpha-glucosidase [Plakobranchus ocellatus]|uniref:Alpha-glucosidase n=1 Tax=Plakobranchus ocellatus TaxID=259542 RepID=A0AAV3Z1H3_9GAST|nr:alpha-glucosidase [Plakobranchus ocellatus]
MSPSRHLESKAYDDSVPIAVQAQESKRRKRRILKVSVYCMFGIIAMGVFVIWLFHKDPKETLSFGSMFLFTVKLRSLEVKNSDGDVVLYGDMGRLLKATPYDRCWYGGYEKHEDDCITWMRTAKLYAKQYEHRNDTRDGVCYTLHWVGLSEDFVAEDCFYLQSYHWYGVLTGDTPAWPIEGVRLPDLTDYYDEYPSKQDENLVPIWYGSQGVAIFVDSSFPFSVSWNSTEKRQFCIRSKLRADEQKPRDLLQYRVCQADSVKQVYQVAQEHRQNQDTDFTTLDERRKHLLLPRPIHALTQFSDLQELLGQLEKGESQCSLFEIYDDWEKNYGDLEVDPSMQSELEDIIEMAGQQGCYPILPISTFFTFNSKHFQEGVELGFFVRDRQDLVTRMVQWRGKEGAVLDVTNPAAESWFLGHVMRLQSQLQVQALKLLHLNIPPDSSYHDLNMTHLDYTRIFYRDLASLNISLVLEHATGFIPLPAYTPIPTVFNGKAGSACLNTSIPYSLTMSLSGYPLLIADADRMVNLTTTRFMRWLQLAVFFPVLEIPNLSLLKNKTMQNFLSEILSLRKSELLPYLSRVWEKEPSLPILRPLLWAWPDDEQALVINDQFLVGDRLMVAPVLCEGITKRTVYLPDGSWVSHKNNQTKYNGPGHFSFDVKNFTVIPFFWKVDNSE